MSRHMLIAALAAIALLAARPGLAADAKQMEDNKKAVAAFYDATPEAWNCRTDAMRVVHPLAALTANQAAEALRSGGPSAAHGRLRARA